MPEIDIDYFANSGPDPSHVGLDCSVHTRLEDAVAAVEQSHHPYWRIVRAETPRTPMAVVGRKTLADANYPGAEHGM